MNAQLKHYIFLISILFLNLPFVFCDSLIAKNNGFAANSEIQLPKHFIQILERLETKSAEDVMEALLEDSSLKINENIKYETLQKGFSALHDQAGQFISHKTIYKGHMSDHYLRFGIMLKYKNYPVFMLFDIYHNEEKWLINKISVGKTPDKAFRL